MAEIPREPFSKRYGYKQPKEITVWEDAPELVRLTAVGKARSPIGPDRLLEIVCGVLKTQPERTDNAWSQVERLMSSCEWFHVYDFIEACYMEMAGSGGPLFLAYAGKYEQAMNECFEEEGIGWQLANGEILTRGTEAFEAAVLGAADALESARRRTARAEIHQALADLSRRPKPDLTGAVQHAMAALECVARDATGDPKATLGEILKRHPDLIPKPLDTAVEKAWGYASGMGRHIQEGREPQRKEVELIVGLAATVATYLSR
jgi:hypothetical protein